MTVGQLRETIANIPDELEVRISDVNGADIHVANASEGIFYFYLETVQEFPELWFDYDGIEIT